MARTFDQEIPRPLNRRRLHKPAVWGAVAVGLTVAASYAGGLFGGNESNSVRTTPQATTATPNNGGAATPEAGASPETTDAKIVLPTSSDPQELLDQLFANYTLARNTRDASVLKWFYADPDTSIQESGVLSQMAVDENFVKTHPDFHWKYKATVLSAPPLTGTGTPLDRNLGPILYDLRVVSYLDDEETSVFSDQTIQGSTLQVQETARPLPGKSSTSVDNLEDVFLIGVLKPGHS